MANTGSSFKVTEIKGEAYVQKPTGEIVKLNVGDVLEEGDILLTGEGEVTLSDQSGGETTVPAGATYTVPGAPAPELSGAEGGEEPAGEEAPQTDPAQQPRAQPQSPQPQSGGEEGDSSSDGGGSSFFNAPRTDYLQDNRFIDQGNLNRDINDVFSFMGRHTENPRIHYQFDLDRVKFPLYGPEPDQRGGGRRDDYTPRVGQREQDNSDLDSRFELAPDANSVKEDGPLTASGSVLTNDKGNSLKIVGVMKQGDPGAPSSGNVGVEVPGEYGMVKINADGSYNYVLDNDDERVQALAVGEKFTENFVYSATDQRGETQTTTLTITINGTNDAPVIDQKNVGDYTGELTEGQGGFADGVEGKLPVEDVDTSDTVRVKVVGVEIEGNTPDGLENKIGKMLEFENKTVIVNGENDGEIHWKFNPGDEDFKYLGEEETLKLTYTVEVDDGHGGKDQKEITITINGRNDPPTANPDTREMKVGSADEGEDDGNWKTSIIRGNVITGGATGDQEDTDPDANDVLKVVGVKFAEDQEFVDSDTVGEQVNGKYGKIVINEKGSYTYTLDNEHGDFENFGKNDEPKEEIFTYTIEDGQGETSHTTITITIRGAMLFADSNTVTEDADDQNDIFGGLTDGQDETSIIGGKVLENDKADGLKVTKIANSDNAEADVVWGTSYNNGAVIEGQYGTLKIGADGKYTYTLNNENPDVDALAVEEKLTEKFTYTAVDKDGDKDSATLTITINGANDSPKITLEDGDSNYEEIPETDEPLGINGTLSLCDVDKSDVVSVKKTGVKVYLDNGEELTEENFPGGLTVEEILAMFSVNDQPVLDSETDFLKNGIKWKFDSSEEAFNFLPKDKELKFVYTVEANDRTDDTGLTDTETVTIVIKGTNDAPELESDSGRVKEDGAETQGSGDANATSIVGGNVLDNDKDVDIGDKDKLRVTKIQLEGDEEKTVAEDGETKIPGTYGDLYIDSEGNYRYELDNTKGIVQALAQGQTETEVFTYTATDGHEEKSITLTIYVDGTNDAPEIQKRTDIEDSDSALDLDDKHLGASGTLTPYDVDTQNEVTISKDNTVTATASDEFTIPLTQEELLDMFTFTSPGLGNTQQEDPNGITWTFTGTPKAFDFIPTGESVTLVYTLRADDEIAPGYKTVTIKITGTDDTGSLGSGVVTTTNEDETKTGNVLTTDSPGFKDDPDHGEQVRITIFTIEGREEGESLKLFTAGTGEFEEVINEAGNKIGVFKLNTDGTYEFKPIKDYSGPVPTITYAARSGSVDIGSSTLKITVNPVADAPAITIKSDRTPEDTPILIEGLKLPVITDAEQFEGPDGHIDYSERLGVITLEFQNFLHAKEGAKLYYMDGSEEKSLIGDIVGNTLKIYIEGVNNYHINGADEIPGVVKLTRAQYESLYIQQAADSDKNIKVFINATSYEVDGDGNRLKINNVELDGKETTKSFNIFVDAVTDDVDLNWNGEGLNSFDNQDVGKDWSGVDPNNNELFNLYMYEDRPVNIKSLLKAEFDDLDGTETRWFVIKNTTDNDIYVNGDLLKAGAQMKIEASNMGTSTLNLPDIFIKGAGDFSGEYNGIEVILVGQDKDADNDLTNYNTDGSLFAKTGDQSKHYAPIKYDTVYLNMKVLPVAGEVTTTIASDTKEDPEFTTTVPDGEYPGARFMAELDLTDKDGSEKITEIKITSIPAGWEVYDHEGNLVSAGDIVSTSKEIYSKYTAIPPANSSSDGEIILSVKTSDTANINGVDETVFSEYVTVTAKVTVTPVAESLKWNDVTKEWGHQYTGGVKDGDGNPVPDLTMTDGHDYKIAAEEDVAFELSGSWSYEDEGGNQTDEFSFKEGWANQDPSEKTYALLSPKIWVAELDENGEPVPDDDGGFKGEFITATGAKFTWDGGEDTFDGSNPVEIPVEALDSVKFTAPPNMAGEFRIAVQAKTVDYDEDHPADIGKADTAISGEAILQNLIVNPVADKVTVAISQAVGKEDEPIKLDIRPSSEDPNETFNVTILKASIPDGAKFTYDEVAIDPKASIGTKFADGRVEVTADGVKFIDYKPGLLSVTPPLNSDTNFTLKVNTVAVDIVYTSTGEMLEAYTQDVETQTLQVKVDSVADGATLDVKGHTVTEAQAENGEITLNNIITNYEMIDKDGSEEFSLVVTGLGKDFSLEGKGITFLGGTDAGRKWSITIDDSSNLNETLKKVYIKVQDNFNGKIELTAQTVTTEIKNGDAFVGTEESGGLKTAVITVTPTPEAGMNLTASGNEDAKVKLDFSVEHKGGDTDEEITKVWIRADGGNGVDGKEITLFSKEGEGPYTELESTVIGEEEWYEISYNDLGKIYAQGPANFSGKLEFKVKYEVTDPGNGVPDKTTSSDEVDYTLTIAPVTDKTETTLPDEESKFTTDEKSDVAIVDGYVTITATGETTFSFVVTVNQQPDSAAGGNADVDGSEKLEYFIIDNVPAGLSIEGGHYMGNSSTGVFTGRWIVKMEGEEAEFNADPDTNPDGAVIRNFEFTLDNSAGLFNFHDESYPITITAYSRDGEAINQETSDAKWTLKIDLQGEGGGYDLIPATVNAEIKLDPVTNKMQPGEEDKPLDLKDLVTFTITDNNDPEQDGYDLPRFSITLTGLPEGTVVHGMIKDGDVWTASSQGGQDKLDQLVGTISIELPKDWNSNNHSGDDAFKFDATITSYTPGGQTTDKTAPGVEPYIEPVTDPAQISIEVTSVDEHQSEGGDDVEITIDLSNAADGSNARIVDGKLYLKLDGLNNEGTLELKDSGSSYSLEEVLVNGYYVISNVNPTDNIELIYTPKEYVSGKFSVEAYVDSQEKDASDEVRTEASGNFTINPVNSGYDFTGGTTGTASGDEDTKILINAAGKLADWEDGSEEIVSATLTNVPEGFIVYTGGNENGEGADIASNAGGGTWSIPLTEGGELPERIWVKAPENWSGVKAGDDRIELNVYSSDSGNSPSISTKFFTIEVNPAADGIKIEPTQTFGKAGEEIAINLNASMEDTDASETVTLTFKGVGEYAQFLAGGTTLSHSYDGVTDTYTLSGITYNQVRDLYLVQGAMNTKQITVEAWTVDEALNAGGATVTDKSGHVTKTFDLTISPVGGTIGNDTMLYYTGHTLDGKAGTDTLEFRYGETVDFNATGVVGNIKNFEIFDLTGNGEPTGGGAQKLLNLSVADVKAMTDGDNTLTIEGTSDDVITLAPGWGTADTLTNSGYHTYEEDGVILKVKSEIFENSESIQGLGGGMGKMMAMGAFSFDPEEGGSDGQGGSTAGYEPFPQSGESGSDGQEWDSSSPSSQEGEGSSRGSDWNAAGSSGSGDGDSEQGGGSHGGSGASDTGLDMIPIGSGPETSSGGDSDPEGQGGLDEALEGLSAADVFDMGNDDLPLPGGDGDDGPGNVPDTGGADVPEFYAPDVPDSAAQIAEEMEQALSA